MTGNNIILRIVKNGITSDLQVDKNVPLRVDMSALESQQVGKLFGIGSQEFNIPGTNESNTFFDFAFNPGIVGTWTLDFTPYDCSLLMEFHQEEIFVIFIQVDFNMHCLKEHLQLTLQYLWLEEQME